MPNNDKKLIKIDATECFAPWETISTLWNIAWLQKWSKQTVKSVKVKF